MGYLSDRRCLFGYLSVYKEGVQVNYFILTIAARIAIKLVHKLLDRWTK
jgi:hypothetical protein